MYVLNVKSQERATAFEKEDKSEKETTLEDDATPEQKAKANTDKIQANASYQKYQQTQPRGSIGGIVGGNLDTIESDPAPAAGTLLDTLGPI